MISELLSYIELNELLIARLQMALTLGVHIIPACLGVGMPLLLVIAEGLYLNTGDQLWRILAKRWAKAFAVLFAVGAVSGTVLSFELGLLWPEFIGRFGSVIGLPFTLEGFAFFIEAIFVGIYLYGWDRLTPFLHWLSGIPIAIAGVASAWFVVTANSWMNSPTGFTMEQGKVIEVDPIAAMFNQATGAQTTHMILAAYIVSGCLIASYYSAVYLFGKVTLYHKRAMLLGLTLITICSPLQIIVGDWAAKVVAKTQPVKLAAMEGQYQTETNAPLRIGGIPNDKTRTTNFAIEIPGMLSMLAYGDFNAEVRGLNDYPPEDTPNTFIVHTAFQLMVVGGTFLLSLSLWVIWSFWRNKQLPKKLLFLWLTMFSGPISVLTLEAGWVVTEVGRQPWIIQGVMRTKDAVTQAQGIPLVFAVTIIIYTILIIGTVTVLKSLSRIPVETGEYGS